MEFSATKNIFNIWAPLVDNNSGGGGTVNEEGIPKQLESLVAAARGIPAP